LIFAGAHLVNTFGTSSQTTLLSQRLTVPSNRYDLFSRALVAFFSIQ
jgi:hypothetical protein